jgi:phosphoenolpyruvate carboxylase
MAHMKKISRTVNEGTNKGGRPPFEETRKKRIECRFTEKEYQLIEEMEHVFSLSKANLIRSRVLESAEPLILNGLEFAKELRTIGTELGRAGNNINQLAKHANTLEKCGLLNESVVARFNVLIESYNVVQTDLIKTLRKVTRDSAKKYKI